MTKQSGNEGSAGVRASKQTREPMRGRSEDELAAEQESAVAMNSDVPQPPEADDTSEGQPT